MIIVQSPNSVLNNPAKTVTTFDKRLTKLIRDMKSTLRATRNPKGVGLAAPQVGEPWRVFITREKDADPIRVFINPEIVSHTDPVASDRDDEHSRLEGCLSIPKIWGKVNRFPTLVLKYQDEKGENRQEEIGGFLATIIQHETDHTNGILFVQRVLEQKNILYQAAKDEHGKEVLEEVTPI